MKKVLIISYFYPPANFVGAERAAAWAKHLSKNGYYPIIITRQWNDGQIDLVDKVDRNEFEHLISETHEVYRVPYHRSLRDKCARFKWLKPIQKILSLWELIFSNFTINALPYSNMYSKAKEILQKDPTIKLVVVSGRPFQSFQFGYKLKKEFDIEWIPDYRDEWTTHQNPVDRGIIWNWISKLERRSEIKWTSNASAFITVSRQWKTSISKLISKEGFVVMNGYESISPKSVLKNPPNDSLRILYAGTLYPSQEIEVFITASKQIEQESVDGLDIHFIGTNVLPAESERLVNLTRKMSNVHFKDRIMKKELNAELQQADILLLTSFKNVSGWYPVKLFEYYASGKPILLCPSDHGVIKEFIEKTNSGVVVDSIDECKSALLEWLHMKKAGKPIHFERNLEEGMKYSREYQTKKLAEVLDHFSNN